MYKKDDYTKLADSYFDYLAEHFPVMCASDEFHFLPRAENACNHYDKMDDLEESAVEETIAKLKEFQKDFSFIGSGEGDLENTIDLQILQANVAGILIELHTKRSWQYNPLLYLKIAFIGLDHALTKPATEPKEIQERVHARLSAISRILKQGIDNIHSIPDTYHQASLLMVEDCKQYLSETAKVLSELFVDQQEGIFTKSLADTASALKDFTQFLGAKPPEPDRQFAVSTLKTSLKDHFLSKRTPEEIFQIAVEEWHQILKQLESLQSKINPGKTWAELYHGYNPSQIEEMKIITLYKSEIDRLRTFFSRNGLSQEDLKAPIEIIYTPTYLKSVRSSASFAAAFSQDPEEKSLFYVTTQFPRQNSKDTDTLLQKRLHREYKMLTAHETIPGHHFLDSIRRRLKNPVRRQIESPLFYEGWASFSESMLIEYGYIKDPQELLVDGKRRLWRSARCQIDVGLTIGKLSHNEAIELLKTCGFTPQEAFRQLEHYRLNPGYQLCYSLGSYEFRQLKENYGNLLREKDFHRFVLEGGELPFHLIEKRFDGFCHKK
ncbi:MAG: DUF885 family protein [Desulfobacterales bacterium]|nr:MAG: DUF885 family protein [Desulfobacterales bacterium]